MSDIASKNRDVWHNAAKTYDAKPWQKQLIGQITEDLRDHREWLGLEPLISSDGSTKSENVSKRLLDYACGPGTISLALEPYITSTVGIDIAPGMVDEYNRRMSNAGLSQFHAIVGDLCSKEGIAEDLKGEDLSSFDIAAIGMGFHHFEHLQLSVDRLVEKLKPSGVLFIVDLLEHDGDMGISDNAHENNFMKEAAHTAPHKHGFSREQMKALFDTAGCNNFDFVVLDRPITMGDSKDAATKKVFVAKASKS